MTRARSLLVAGLVCALAAACGTGTGTRAGPAPAAGAPTASGTAAPPSRVDVDTPALRALRHRAHLAPCPASTATPPRTGGLPDVTLPCLGGGRAVRLSGLRGPLVVNLFAQWCGPCRAELPSYQRLHETGAGRVRVLGLDYLDTRPDGALVLAAATGVTYPLVADPGGSVRTAFRTRGLPGVVLVDARGRVVDVEYRVMSSFAELRSLVERRLHVLLPA